VFKTKFGLNGKFVRPWNFGDGSWAPPPRVIFLIVNNSCNARCIMCDIGLRNKDSSFYHNFIQTEQQEFGLDLAARLCDETKGYRPRIHINGVEPLLHKDIAGIINLFKSNGHFVQVITNGILLAEQAEQIVKSGLDILRVSVDGVGEIHDKIRGPGVYQQVIRGLQAVFQAKIKLGASKPRIIANYTITNFNHDHLADFTHEFLRAGLVDGIQFKHMYFVTEAMSDLHNRLFSHLGPATPTNLGKVDLSRIDVDILWTQYRIARKIGFLRVDFWPNLISREMMLKYYQRPEETINGRMCLTPWKSVHVLPNGETIIRSRCFEY